MATYVEKTKRFPDQNDWREFLRGCTDCAIFCHGGCLDGLGAALLVQTSFEAIGISDIKIIESTSLESANCCGDDGYFEADCKCSTFLPYQVSLHRAGPRTCYETSLRNSCGHWDVPRIPN